jgi:tRNA-(ms[2]io[6]A)-hydroxylase
MLSLAAPTDRHWLDAALADLPTLLVDHAHCEKKAASSAIALIFRHADVDVLLRPLSALAREELVHFEQVLDVLRERGFPFRHLEPSPYAGRLLEARRREEPQRLLDTLLCRALIEARSCERMRLLAESLPDAALARFYHGLLASEARHFALHTDLARRLFPTEEVASRLTELARHEAAVLARSEGGARMHD